MTWQTMLRGVFVTASYSFAFWRIAKTNRGNRVIECGVISLALCFALAFIVHSGAAPDWVLESLGALLILMCFVTVGLFVRECYVALRNRLMRKTN